QFSTGKGDADVEEMILQIYHFALGQPFPEEWLKECRAAYQFPDSQETTWAMETPPPCGRRQDDPPMQNRCAMGGSMETPPWFSFMESDTSVRLNDVKEQLELALHIVREPDGPYPYEKALLSDLELVDTLCSGKTFAEYLNAFRNMGAWARLGSKKDERISEEKKQQVAAIRAECKDQINALRERYYYDDIDVLQEEFLGSSVVVRVLTGLTEAFMKRLSEKKAEKNVLDFGDMEHLALNALVRRDDESGDLKPSAVALEYAETFEEVMIDEYQDSNLVQELILSSVSGKCAGAHNRFMVGDVKQSIYRFRLARPELFMEKYHTYCPAREGSTEKAENAENAENTESTENMENAGNAGTCRIDLHRNFRSRRQVLDSVNQVFRQIMTEPLGGVAYDDDAALYPGAEFPEPPDVTDPYQTELLLLNGEAMEEMEASHPASSASLREEEAKMIGRRILELVGSMPVADKDAPAPGLRPAGFGDIVILLRTVSGWAETFGEVLADMGIPVYTGSQKGYFSAAEVRTVLSYLQILDNPLQDIPLAAVLRSPIGRFTDEELAKIRIAAKAEPKASFYDCCRRYMMGGSDGSIEASPISRPRDNPSFEENIVEKLRAFFAVYEDLRAKCAHTPVHQLIWEMLDVTGYGEYAAALPAGQQRQANLNMLVEKAIAYEATSFRGLYHFVRYIENLQKYEVDYGEASLTGEAGDVVRIMSIHKSKGLEFPIVFVSGMGKAFNESDARSRVVMHPEWGIACDYTSNVRKPENSPDTVGLVLDESLPRMRQATLLKKAIQEKLSTENLGEELRVLYVAMTRAKEKLILTGGVKNLEKKMQTWEMVAPPRDARRQDDSPMQNRCAMGESMVAPRISYSWLSGASNYLDWVVPAVLKQSCAMGGSAETTQNSLFSVRVISPEKNRAAEQTEQANDFFTLQDLLRLDRSRCQDEETREYLEKVFSSAYPYERNQAIPGKVTVSELKKMSQKMEENDAQEVYEEETVVPLVPRFMNRTEASDEKSAARFAGAADRGTAYHAFMENLDFSKKEDLRLQLEELISCGKMSGNAAASIRLE
ncbi:MAG: UvrD-helicase domain-containing protein, partial [Lachnospiraceae bacterium]|nr:UvrD-helicase domain-containing protein [Lachnospiraceae bacterium]